MRRSRGFRNKTRRVLKKDKKRVTITEKLKTFSIGDSVIVKLEPSTQGGMPHPRYHGVYGKVSEKRGRSYAIDIKDKNKPKKLIASPEHLKKM